MNRKASEGRKVPCRIPIAGAVSHPVFGEVAGVYHAAVVALGNGIQGGHPKARGHIDTGLPAGLMAQFVLHFGHQGLESRADIHAVVLDSQVLDEPVGIINIRLHPVGHGYANHPVHSQRLCTQRGTHAAVLATRNAQHGIAPFPVFFKPVPYPLYALVFYFYCVKHSFFLQKYTKD